MSKRNFIFLVTLFFLPFVLSTLYFQYVSSSGSGDQSTVNYGTLVSPMKPIKNYSTKGFWTFVVFAEKCDTSCKKRLFSAETTRVLTNENMKRVRTVYLGKTPLQKEHLPTNLVPKINSPLGVSNSSTSSVIQQWEKLSQQFDLPQKLLLSSILLIDPAGNFMLFYPQDKQDPKRMIRDMKRLLKYSRIG